MTKLMEIKVYIANLGAYNEGRLVGKWATLPIDEDELQEIVDSVLGENYEEIAVHDYEGPFPISEYDSLTALNEFMEELQRLQQRESVENSVLEVLFERMDNKEEVLEVLEKENYRVYGGCDSMEEVAREFLEESGGLSEVPEILLQYFNWEEYARDMDINGHFYKGSGFYVEVLS